MASITLTLTESNINQTNNTSVVTAVLQYVPSSYKYGKVYFDPFHDFGYNNYFLYGTVTIDGTSYYYEGYFSTSKVVTLATFSKTVTHNADGTKTVSVQGKCSGTSGNLTTEKSLTLTTITRTFTIKYDLNKGSGSFPDQIKNYGQSLVLYSEVPTRTGYNFTGWLSTAGNKYSAGSTYSSNSDTTLTAQWVEKSAIINYFSQGNLVVSDTVKYSTSYNFRGADISRTGYTLLGWSKYVDAETVEIELNQHLKDAYSEEGLSNLTLYAVWSANEYTIHFDLNDGEGDTPEPLEIHYNDSINIPIQGNIERFGYNFKGWSTNKDSLVVQYVAGSTTTWNIASNTTLYVVWESIAVPVYYMTPYNDINPDDFSKPGYYVVSKASNGFQTQDYSVENVVIEAPPNYSFTGCWTINKPNQEIKTKRGITFPAGIIPHDESVDLSNSNFVTTGSIIKNVLTDIYLYPVFRDDTPSTLAIRYTNYNYIPNSTGIRDYYRYCTGQTSSINTSLCDNFIVSCTRFSTPSGQGGLDNGVNLQDPRISQPSAMLTTKDGKTIISIPLETCVNTIVNYNNNSNDIYLLYKNTSELVDSANLTYTLTITNIYDNFGKRLNDISIVIHPPKIVRDVNRTGTVVKFFDNAPDYSDEELTTHNKDELWVDGRLISSEYLVDEIEAESSSEDPPLIKVLRTKFPNTYTDYLTLGRPDINKIIIYLINNEGGGGDVPPLPSDSDYFAVKK